MTETFSAISSSPPHILHLKNAMFPPKAKKYTGNPVYFFVAVSPVVHQTSIGRAKNAGDIGVFFYIF
jgi:hypothetical protein